MLNNTIKTIKEIFIFFIISCLYIISCIAMYLSGIGWNFFSIVFTILCLLFLYLIWKYFSPINKRIIFNAVIGAIVLPIVGYCTYQYFHNRYLLLNKTVEDSVFNLNPYQPFVKNTKAVSLNGSSTLKLHDNLPRLDGATALYPVYAAFAQAVYPVGNYPWSTQGIVACNTTDMAYTRLISGEADIIFVAGPSKGQLQMAEEHSVTLKLTPIGLEAFVFFVNAKNRVNNLTLSDIKGIYSGDITNWKMLGGKEVEIQAFQRTENSGSQTALENIMGNIPLMTPPQDYIDVMGDMIQNVATYKNNTNAIGYSFLYFATEMINEKQIKLLSIDGISPTRENVANQTYPFSSEFYAITDGTDNPHVEAFIEWILSEQGQFLIKKTGYAPLY